MAAVFPWARTNRFRIMIVDTTQPPPAHRAPHAPLWRPNRSAAELSLVGTLTLSDLAPHHLEPEGQSAVMAGALSLDRSAGGALWCHAVPFILWGTTWGTWLLTRSKMFY